MKFPLSSPTCGLFKARRAIALLFCLLVCAPGVTLANRNVSPAKPVAQPVARMVTASRQETPQRARAKMVSTFRNSGATPAASVTLALRAAVAVAATGSERRAFELINEERQARGRKPLAWDGELTRLARYHSENMARQDFFNHVDRDGLDMSGRAERLGVRGWRALAENIAYNQGYDDPEAFAVERWMTSNKHRENILNGDFTHAGLGVARTADGRVFFTQVFVKR